MSILPVNSYVQWVAKRAYQLKKRAQVQRETRRRIVDATVALHREVGPASTSISAIAERAGVQRLTVYRHFPNTLDLLRACSRQSNEENPLPDPASWTAISDPGARLEAALTGIYESYRLGEVTFERVLRDAKIMPELAEVMAPMWAYLESVAELVVGAWDVPAGRRRLLRVAVLHALRFETWSSLMQQGLDDQEAVDLMRRFVMASSEPTQE